MRLQKKNQQFKETKEADSVVQRDQGLNETAKPFMTPQKLSLDNDYWLSFSLKWNYSKKQIQM
jgi:hypothetical protein